MVRLFANGPGDLGSIPGRVIQKTLKMVLDASLLNTQHYKVRIKGKVEKSRKGVAPTPIPWCSSYREESLRVTLDYGLWSMHRYSPQPFATVTMRLKVNFLRGMDPDFSFAETGCRSKSKGTSLSNNLFIAVEDERRGRFMPCLRALARNFT